MFISILNFRTVIQNSKTFTELSGTDKFKQTLLLKNYKNIHNDFEQAKRLGIDYVAQYATSAVELKLITELIGYASNKEQ